MLIILKLFKLKLLLFLPFILGITGLKKILGLAALLIPGKYNQIISSHQMDFFLTLHLLSGVIGYFKLCRPTSGFSNHIYSPESHIPQYSSQGLGGASYNPLYSKYSTPYREEPSFASPYNNYYRDSSSSDVTSSSSSGVRFGDDAQDLAYRSSKPSS